MKTCFEGLVALSRTNCDCFPVDNSIKESSLNLFVDEHEAVDLQLIQNAIGCGEDLKISFNKIYENAVNFFESDLQVSISENYRQKHTPYIGRIAEVKYDKSIPLSPLMGLKLETNNVDSASIVINSLSLFFDSEGIITLSVYQDGDKMPTDYEIPVTEGSTNFSFPTPLILPISTHGIKNNYYFLYTSDGPKPMNNKNSCACQGIESVRGKFLKSKGVSGTAFLNLKSDNTYANGISLDAAISCSIDGMLCDFMVDNLFKTRAGIALWYKMGALMIAKLFASRDINFDTMSDREYLYGQKKKFEKEYNGIVHWLSENTLISNSNCFICDTKKSISMGKILI